MTIGHSLIGDKIYGSVPKLNKKYNVFERDIIYKCKNFSRQALHSKTLSFQHPILKEKKGFIGTGIDISLECIKVCKNNINKT